MFESPVDIVRDADKHITAYDVEVGAHGVRTVCSAGGSALPFKELVGWTEEPNVAPLRRDEIVYVVVSAPPSSR